MGVKGSASEPAGGSSTTARSPSKASSPSKKRGSSADSNDSVSSTEIDFTQHVPIYKQYDANGKKIIQKDYDPLLDRLREKARIKKKKEEPEYKQNFLSHFLEEAEEKIQHEE